MYLFPITAIPLGYFFLTVIVFPSLQRRDAIRAYSRGLFGFLPLLLVELIVSIALDPGYGASNFIAYEWARLILPSALVPAACFGIFYKFDFSAASGETDRLLLSFYAGALSPLGVAESIRIWERPEPYTLFILPFALAAIALAAPVAIRLIRKGRATGVIAAASAALLGSAILSLGHWLFLANLWPLAALTTMAALLVAWHVSLPALWR
jgi:hypothetical protein